jgi:hypothetical protein
MVQITEVNREPATTVSTLTATTEVTSPSVTADSASVTNAVDAGSVTAATLEAGGWSFIGAFQTLSDFESAASSDDYGFITEEQQFAYQS